MPTRIPARNVTGDQIYRGTAVSGEDVQHVRKAWPDRVDFAAKAIGPAVVTTEALLSLTPSRDAVDGSAVTSIAVTAGKRLRLTALTLTVRNTGTAAIVPVEIFVRVNPSGAAAVTSPIQYMMGAANPAATLQTMGFAHVLVHDGIEIPAGAQFGISHVSRNTTNGVLNVVAYGFEYLP